MDCQCECQDCEPECENEATAGQKLCFDCDGGDHLPDRDKTPDDEDY